ncbi:hypothetical protein P153DRAFT_370197 [Dothidotthia symphoricarpi CBS 119687]|uniref:Chromatin assembly factor 1 subunit A n=1 Tax=Dothidotthia symphoricarpi CBS 119687 TaxID=1392245 RepID=A0A6A6A301_9PLEO|nr:uncharacterized protein P153DRAFT_370197 [Dothidotthia symphoricarpi CBS 119687]KAF2125543.1 hypothetical protein P153DRAFT_370197 [Dothidotthia symphoricarpi CBS 119687]
MEDPTPVVPVPHKRPLEDEVEPPVSTPTKSIRSEASTPLSVISNIQTPSPFKNVTPHTTAPDNSSASAVGNATPTPNTQQSSKRRKLTQKEKEDQRLEKEAKAKARDEKKAQKEAEDKLKAEQKAQKEDEKRLKEEEKQKAQRERDEKKRQKEEEQQQKEEEKAKKERSQMKLNAFFVKPKTTSASGGQAVVDSIPNPTAPPVSLLPDIPGTTTNSVPPSPQKMIVRNAQSDYDRYFLPFSLPAHAIIAPRNALMTDPAKVEAARTRLDSLIAQENVCMEPITPKILKSTFPAYVRRGMRGASAAEVFDCVHGSSNQPDVSSRQPLDMLKTIPMKYIHFGEDVRPPYYGTYTHTYTDAEASRLARNPHSRLRQDTNYDYDSEAEWDEPEEGEDLDSEGEDDADEEGEDDMDGFLDDEEDPQARRRHISGDLVPVSTGLCWEDEHGVSRLNDGSEAICTDFREFQMGFLLQPQPHSIDPFSTAYWTPEPAAITTTLIAPSKDATSNGLMNPPRAPLAQRTMNGLLNTLNPPQTPPASTTSKAVKAKRLIPADQLPAFKAEVEGKDLTKIGMIEALKKAFPKLPKDAIANTLSSVAARVGPTEKEKRWVLINA